MNPQHFQPSAAPLVYMFITFLAIGALFFYFKMRGGLKKQTSRLKILDRIHIDKKIGLMIVEAQGEKLLLSFSPNGFQKIKSLESFQIDTITPDKQKEKIIEFPTYENLHSA
jgi:hypothetical protein